MNDSGTRLLLMSGILAASRDVRLLTSTKGLQVGQLHHQEQRLLERIANRRGFGEQQLEHLADQLRNRRGNKGRGADPNRGVAQTPGVRGLVQQVVGKQSVQVGDGIAIDADLFGRIDQ